jgi:BlaI family transcriptional regulator, penicillinase repressor
MERLTKAEEPVMHIIWKEQMVFVKDIIELLPDPKPPYNTISSLVRILEGKGLVDHETFGKTHRYFPKVSKNEYRRSVFSSMMSDYFDGSYESLMSFIVSSKDLSADEAKKLKDIINKKNHE